MSALHWILVALGLVVAVVLGVLLSVSFIENRQARELHDMEPYAGAPEAQASGVAVVFFSRSGNTALAARHVARRLNAQLFQLESPDHQLGPKGLANALKDANALKGSIAALPDITPRTIDLAPFHTVYLGAPVWLYSPAPPIWAFIEHNHFDGKRVVLFNTYNSHIGPDHIEAFRAKVMARGAASFEHRHVLRGRMTQQLTPQQMLQAIDEEWFGAAPSPRPERP